MTEMGEFGPGQDWDARAHVRLLRTNGGASSGYTADLIERLYTELIAAALASRPSQGGETEEPKTEIVFRTAWEIEQERLARKRAAASPSPYGVEDAPDELGFVVGEPVEKFTGEARWEGILVASYLTTAGQRRYVVEVKPQGFQMIATPGQLRMIAALSGDTP